MDQVTNTINFISFINSFLWLIIPIHIQVFNQENLDQLMAMTLYIRPIDVYFPLPNALERFMTM